MSMLKSSFRFVADKSAGTVRKTLDMRFVGESRDLRVFLVDVRVEGMPEDGNVNSHQSMFQYRG